MSYEIAPRLHFFLIEASNVPGGHKPVIFWENIPTAVFLKWKWYFDYRAALYKVQNPRMYVNTRFWSQETTYSLDRGVPKSEVQISFEFVVFYRTESDGKKLYEVDREWHDEHSTTNHHTLHSESNLQVMPFSEELAQQCIAMVASLNDVNDRIRELLATPEQAMATLASPGLRLLGQSTPPPTA